MSKFQTINSSAELDYPKVLPTLDLNFATTKTLDPRITFTRSSGGTYVDETGVIRIAGVNQPRFDHNPLTGECLGLLIEQSRTNSLTNSIIFTSGWSNQNILSSVFSTFEFFSSNNVIKITPNTSNTNQHSYNASGSPITSSSATFSVFAKMDGYRYLWIRSDGASGGAVFDLQNGVTSTTVNGSSSIVSISNGWYRCGFTGSFSTGLSIRIGVSIDTGFNGYPTTSFSGNNISGILISSPQLEVGAFQTSYIPTGASAITRSADTATITGTNFSSWFNPVVGTFYVDAISDILNIYKTRLIYNSNGWTPIALGTGAPSFDRVLQIEQAVLSNNTINASLFMYNGGGTNFGPNTQNLITVSQNTDKVAFYCDPPNQSYAICTSDVLRRLNSNSGLTGDQSYTLANMMQIGYNSGYRAAFSGIVKQITYWPRKLPNDQILRRLTE